MRFKQVDNLLAGELQKSVWSLMKEYKTMRAKDIADKLGRQQSNVTGVLNVLIDHEAVERVTKNGKVLRGLYKVKKGVTKWWLK